MLRCNKFIVISAHGVNGKHRAIRVHQRRSGIRDDLESNQSLLESLEARSDLTRALQTEIEAAVKVRGRYFIWLFLYDVKILSLGFS